MKTVFYPKKLSGKVCAPPSKSYLHRLLIAAALSGSDCFIPVDKPCGDVLTTAKALKTVFGNIEYSNGGYRVSNKPFFDTQCNLFFGESGSTFRFLLPVILSLGLTCKFNFSENLLNRIKTIPSCFTQNGATVNRNFCKGKLTCGEYRLSGKSTSQFVSGLLFGLPLLNGDSQIIVTDMLASKPYVDITLDVLQCFGIVIVPTENGFFVKGNQVYKAPKFIRAEGDWSSGAVWLAACALNSRIDISGLKLDTKQGDIAILDVLKDFGAKVIIEDNCVTAISTKLKAITYNAENTPDLVPLIAVLAGCAEGSTKIINIARLKNKESNRIESTVKLINSLGGMASCDESSVTVTGTNGFTGGSVNTFGDHRIAMAAALASTVSKGKIIIDDLGCTKKSYPSFCEDFLKLNGNMKGE